ncbi:uncharacterized protein PHACADRAFT_88567 [Phanerochaete carnosa HHB-10118-sp]|uniref:Uncharacterized protein n=1 Tax=Phanerochaete carnosa (strain HHB-10118-sp) TaxID=650164 RepID=K5X7S3_PHACS|nr:uncharacterized protein PHACADRAFT_88567 [Phanerochaete carnosa HHB-10118-sp]EKM58892.1 hypothetical protein PHACADRAFT_88567 [Phanerochaete carnosa HHB-10118-sp]
MFRLFRQSPAPDKVYSSSLQTLHLGYALWYPEPHKSGEPQIGDVGFIREGAFIRLFNLDTSAPEKKVTFWPTPFEDIEPLPPNVLQVDPRSRPLAPDHYSSHGVESKGVHASANVTTSVDISAALSAEYTCKAAQGAVLALKSEAHAETIFENHALKTSPARTSLLKTYIVRNYDKWYEYVKRVLNQDIKQENIVVISGWVKTEADWAAAAFSNSSSSFSGSLKGRAGGGALGAEVGGTYASSVSGPKMHRHGKRDMRQHGKRKSKNTKPDQSVFVKQLKVLKRLILPWKVVAGAGYDRLPDRREERDDLGGVPVEDIDGTNAPGFEGEQGEISDPLDVLLEYILEGGKQVVDFGIYLRQIQPPVNIDGTSESLSSSLNGCI